MRVIKSYITNIPLIIACYIITFIFFILGIFYPEMVLKFSKNISTPWSNIRYFLYSYIPTSVSNFLDVSHSINTLIKENKELEYQLIYRSLENSKLSILEKENETLRSLLNYKSNFLANNDIVVTNIYVPDISISFFNKELFLNTGLDSSIEEGNLVVSTKGVVGYVEKVFNTSSVVITSLDQRFRISAVTNISSMNVIITGNSTINPDIIVYYENNPIQVAEILYTSGLEGNFPYGIPIGKIIDIKGEKKVELFENFSSLNYVYIIK